MKLRPQILSMRPGTRVVSHSFTMEDGKPTRSPPSTGGAPTSGWCRQTSWQLDAGKQRQKTDLTLEQTFQKINGAVTLGAVHGGLRDPRLRGASISFGSSTQRRAGRLRGAR